MWDRLLVQEKPLANPLPVLHRVLEIAEIDLRLRHFFRCSGAARWVAPWSAKLVDCFRLLVLAC